MRDFSFSNRSKPGSPSACITPFPCPAASVHVPNVCMAQGSPSGPANPRQAAAARAARQAASTLAPIVPADFQTQISKAAKQLKERGWAVVEGVLLPEECEQYRRGVWGWLGRVGSGIREDDPARWAPVAAVPAAWLPASRPLL
jgi:hypothetical protein